MPRIFISYRRQDSEGYVGRLYDRLADHFPAENLFMDVVNIQPGVDFVEALDAAVAGCDVCLVVIGPTWATITDESGQRRLDHSNDFVRIEVESALRADKRVIPVLVGGARMPNPDLLPASIAALTRRNAVEVAHKRFKDDVDLIAQAIRASESTRRIKPKADAETLQRKQSALNALRAELINATDSPLYPFRVQNKLMPVLGDGYPDAGILFIGESPGKTEAADGRAFVGASGKVLDELLDGLRIRRADVYITNLILDHPGGREPNLDEIAFYAPYLDRLIATIEPRVIAPLGRFAAHHILKTYSLPGAGQPISGLNGRLIEVALPYGGGVVVPLLHPAAALYQASSKEAIKRGFETLRKFA